VAPCERFSPLGALHWHNSEPIRNIAAMMLVPGACFQDFFHRQRNPTGSDQVPEEPSTSTTLTVTSDSLRNSETRSSKLLVIILLATPQEGNMKSCKRPFTLLGTFGLPGFGGKTAGMRAKSVVASLQQV